MPFGGTTKKEDKKIERCVSEVMKTGKSKSSAIAICKSSIMKEEKMEKETFTYTPTNEMECMGNKIANVHIFKPGEYRGKTWTKEIVDTVVKNFKKLKQNAGFEPPVRVGHRVDDPIQNAKSVIGYIEDLHADEKGNLYADMDITDDAGYESIKNKTLRKRSIEFGPYEDNDKNEYDTVCWGVGWVDIPQVEGLVEVNVYSKTMEEQVDKVQYDKLVSQAEDLMANKGSQDIVKECIDSLKKLLTSKIKDEKFFDVSRISNFISGLKSEYAIAEEGVDMAKVGDACKMPDGSEGEMMEEGGKMVCKGKAKMDKEESEEKTEDSAEETPKEGDAKVDLDKEEAGDEEESDDDSEDMDKKTEMVEMSKSEVAELKAAKKKLDKIEAEEVTTKLAKRMEIVDNFTKGEVKIIPAMLEKEKEFVETLSDEQFDKYIKLKEEMPNLVELDKDFGKQKSSKEDEESEELKAQKEAKSRALVIDTMMRTQGLTKEQAEKLVK